MIEKHMQYFDLKIRYEVVRAPSPWKLDYFEEQKCRFHQKNNERRPKKRKKMKDSKTHWLGPKFSTVLLGQKTVKKTQFCLQTQASCSEVALSCAKVRALLCRRELTRLDANGAAQHRTSWSGMVRSGATRIL